MNGTDNPISELNAIVQKISQEMGIELVIKPGRPKEIATAFLHPIRYTEVYRGDTQIGGMSEVHKRMTDYFGIDKRVVVFEIELTEFIEKHG
jgi:phenylalanyl-tRNA synthetase beta subunit